jgi:ubiquinone/menaquinone biosynthesis C-methylase UbiE
MIAYRPRSSDVNLRAAVQMREYLSITKRVARGSPGPVLDWGCGYGQIADLLGKDGVKVTAFDWSPDAASNDEVLPLERFPDVEVHRSSDPVQLPFSDSSFGCVLSCGTLEHVQRPADSLNELHRVLQPAGQLLIYKLPNRFSYLEALARWMGLYYHGVLIDDRVYTHRTAVSLLLHHGFRVDVFRRRNMLPLTITHPVAQALAGPIWTANRALGYVPGLQMLATNLELEATAE